MKTYPLGTPFTGRVDATWHGSEPAFPVVDPAPADAPNVLVVLLDDCGFGQAEVFGGLARTPAMNRLASHGLRYSNFHTTAVCSPTRASLLSGHNHHDCGMGSVPEHATGYPGYDAYHPPERAGMGAILGQGGYSTIALGKWHNTPSEEVGPAGPFERWPTGPIFGFDHFYGVMGGETNQWYPSIHRDREPVDQPRGPEDGYHFSEDLVDEAIRFVGNQSSLAPDKPWMCYLSFGAVHAPHHVAPEWIEPYRGLFDAGWDQYRETVLERQKEIGVVLDHAELAPVMEGVIPWDDLDSDRQRLFARMQEVFAGFLTHTDAQIGRLVDFLEATDQLDNTLIMVIVGDNGPSGEGRYDGTYNEMTLFAGVDEPIEHILENIDNLGQPGSYNHYPLGWAVAGATPFRMCKQYVHLGGVRNPLVVHWPAGIESRGEIRHQFHHVVDVLPTILSACGLPTPSAVNGVPQAPMAGTSMTYSFDDEKAPTTRPVQYFEMFGNRAIVQDSWKAVTWNGRMPWQESMLDLRDQVWELYDLDADPTERVDLAANLDPGDQHSFLARKLRELEQLWWAEAGRHNVLPLDDRIFQRLLGRGGLDQRLEFTLYPGMVRIPERVGPDTKNRSWELAAEITVPPEGARGPLCVTGGDTNGWSLYLDTAGAPTFCYNLANITHTYVRGAVVVPPGDHEVRMVFGKRGDQLGAGGCVTLLVDGVAVAEGEVPQTVKFGYSVDETFDVGCDKGSPVTPEYPAQSEFSGELHRVHLRLGADVTYADPTTDDATASIVVGHDL